ncbi:MAG: DUF2625 family protein [Polyangiaceae bacterium]
MRPLADLVSPDPALPLVRSWIAGATRGVELLPVDRARAEAVLVALQVTTASPMGAIALQTGGIVIDRFLRVLGGGGPRMDGDLARWNGLGDRPLLPARERALIVAHDAIGGFFALDGGGLGDGQGEVFYFAPDTLGWEGIDMGYSDWLEAMMSGLFMDFYVENLWDGWQTEAAALSFDEGLMIDPPLWTLESRPVEKTSRKAVPMLELWRWEQQMEGQTGQGPDDDDDVE